jgi:hypothetical protein
MYGALGVHSGLGPLAAMQSKYRIQKTVGFSSEELSWFLLVWFFFGSEEVEGDPCKFCTLGEIQNWDLEPEQDSRTKLIMLELWANHRLQQPTLGAKCKPVFCCRSECFFNKS